MIGTSLLLAGALGLAPQGPQTDPAAWLRGQLDALETFYQDLHRHPELSFHEEETAGKLAAPMADCIWVLDRD